MRDMLTLSNYTHIHTPPLPHCSFVQFMGNEVEAGLWNDNAGLVHFHDALYFTVVTFATVGYGDMSPGGWMGRLVMLSLIAITFVLVPFETSKLVRLTRLRSAYSGYLSLADGNAHIIVACDVECAGVADFLKEFFHEVGGRARFVPRRNVTLTAMLLLLLMTVTGSWRTVDACVLVGTW